jgi:predicted dehydrogenase
MNLNAAIMGYGMMGQLHCDMYQMHPDIKTITIIDPMHPEKKIDRVKLNKIVEIKGSIDIPDHFDLVSVCTPTFQHIQKFLELIGHTEAILVEKPLGLSLDECLKMQEVERGTKVHLQCALVERHNPVFIDIRNKVLQKDKDLTFILERECSPPSSSSWYWDEKLSGGSLLDLGIHDLDLTVWLTGKTVTDITVSQQNSLYEIKLFQENNVQFTVKTGWRNKENFFKQTVKVDGLNENICFNETDLGKARYPTAYYNQIDKFIKAAFYKETDNSNCFITDCINTFKLIDAIKLRCTELNK